MLGLRKRLRSFIVNNYLFGKDNGFQDSDSFLELGVIDSTGVLELVSHLESEYLLQIESDEIIPDNLDSVDKLAAFVMRKQTAGGTIAGSVPNAERSGHGTDS